MFFKYSSPDRLLCYVDIRHSTIVAEHVEFKPAFNKAPSPDGEKDAEKEGEKVAEEVF